MENKSLRMYKVVLLSLITLFISQNLINAQNINPAKWLRYNAISPDGTKIAFNYKGDLYVVNSQGGDATILTITDAYDFNPIWSPDSKNIAFASDRNGNFDIYLIPALGGESKRLTYFSADDIPNCFTNDGKRILFNSGRIKAQNSMQFNGGRVPELYSVSIDGGDEKLESTIGAEATQFSNNGNYLAFQDKKGYEDPFRKHQISPIARDLWINDINKKKYYKITDFEGEDRNPIFSNDDKTLFYLSELSGNFNLWKINLGDDLSKINNKPEQITKFEKHPVRFLSKSKNDIFCFAFDGEIYTLKNGEEAQKINVFIKNEDRYLPIKNEIFSSGVTDMDISPSGKEVAFIVRGEVFVTSLEGSTTKRITTTQSQERSVSFSPDGRSILYAAEKNNIWGIYQTTLKRQEEKFFYNSTILEETKLVASNKESFQPSFSPNGKEVAFIEDRTAIKIYNLASKEVREVMPYNKSYSYSDGDQWFDWSPDSKYILVQYLEDNHWLSQVGLIDVSNKNPIINLTQSGYDNSAPKWMNKGNLMIWFSNRDGMKNHASHGWENDVYGMFFNQEAYDKFKMSKEDYLMAKEAEELEKKEKEKDKDKNKDKKDSKKEDKKDTNKDETAEKDDKEVKDIKLELEDREYRKVRLTIHSSDLADAIMSPDGESLYYLSSNEGGYDLWVNKLRERETKLLLKLGAGSVGTMKFDSEGKNIFLISDGKILKINPEKPDSKTISFNAKMTMDYAAEREYMFEHAWRQTQNKFYVSNLHNVDWNFYKSEYKKFLPYISNNRDFAELLSELLGELNASHTGGRYRNYIPGGDETANFGVFYDNDYKGSGVKISEIIAKSPFTKFGSKVKVGTIIEKIDGIEINLPNNIESNINYLLNRKAGTNLLISCKNGSEAFDEVVKPISNGELSELLYQRWIRKQQEMTEKLSNGRIGYMHVRGMDNYSFRAFYEQVMGKYPNKEALIVDTRNNGGGWLHDDLATFLSGQKYIEFVPKERKIGFEPQTKWTKPSVVLMSEGNYSDAHMFPYTYKYLNIGKLIGMPVAGTGTAVWWETMQDPTIVFGIPQVGITGMDGKYLENQTLYPDIEVRNDYESINEGRDKQLEKAVEELLNQIGKK